MNTGLVIGPHRWDRAGTWRRVSRGGILSVLGAIPLPEFHSIQIVFSFEREGARGPVENRAKRWMFRAAATRAIGEKIYRGAGNGSAAPIRHDAAHRRRGYFTVMVG